MKRLFSTPKRAIISAVCMIAAITAIGAIAAKSALITRAEAKAVALRDAGLSEAEASALRTRLEFDDGRFQYEVEFYSNGTTYEYFIQAKDGDIIARDIKGRANGNNDVQSLPQNDAENQPSADDSSSLQSQNDAESQPSADGDSSLMPQNDAESQPSADGSSSLQSQNDVESQPSADGSGTAQSQEKSLDEAIAAALQDAGLSESDVTLKKTELDYEHGIQVYDIEFYTSDAKYEYEINASDKTVMEKNVKSFSTQVNTADNSSDSYIGVDRAKEIALNHANLSETDVRFTKAKLKIDDGRAKYEIEFYSGRTEYDYAIDAFTGNIIAYDEDYD